MSDAHAARPRKCVSEIRQLHVDLFSIEVEAERVEKSLTVALPPLPSQGKIYLAAVGKAAASMSVVTLRHYGQPIPGLILPPCRDGLPALCHLLGIAVVEAGHPVPDAQGERTATCLRDLAYKMGPGDEFLVLVSGGGALLLAAPADGRALTDTQAVTRALLARGTCTAEINCVRKHLLAIKGRRLAVAAYPPRVLTLVVSDVVGNDPAPVAPNPTRPDPTAQQEANSIVKKNDADITPNAKAVLRNPVCETPKPSHPAFGHGHSEVVARSADVWSEAERWAGYLPFLIGDSVEGEAPGVGRDHALAALHVYRQRGRYAVVGGAELAVTVSGCGGHGGPNQEYRHSLVQALNGAPGINALACDTDGIDGSGDNAAARIDKTRFSRSRARGLRIAAALRRNRSYGVFETLGDLVVTGPTRTNVNDFRVVPIEGAAGQ